MQPNKLFVANISFEATEEAVRALFEEVGTVEDFYYARDQETGRPRGFCFVTMATDGEAETAIERLHGYDMNGRDLRVSVARPKEDRGPRGGGGGGGGFRPRAPRLGGDDRPRGGGGFRGGPGGGAGGYRGGGSREGGFRGGRDGGGGGGFRGGRDGGEGGGGFRQRPRFDRGRSDDSRYRDE